MKWGKTFYVFSQAWNIRKRAGPIQGSYVTRVLLTARISNLESVICKEEKNEVSGSTSRVRSSMPVTKRKLYHSLLPCF